MIFLAFAALLLNPAQSVLAAQTAAAQKQDPDARAEFERGLALQQSGNLPEAEKAFSEAARLAPHNAAVLGNLGVVRAQLGNYSGAVESYQQALAQNTSMHRLNLNLGIAWFKMGDLEKAVSALDQFLSREPSNSQGQELRGLSLFQLGRFQDSAAQFEELLKRDGEKLAYLYALGQATIQAGDTARGQQIFGRMFALFPEAAETHLLRAQAMMSGNQYEEAVQELDQAAKRNPQLPGLQLWRGIAWEGLGHPEEALKCYRAEIRDTGDLIAYYAAGILELKSENAKSAVDLLEKARALDSERYNVSYYLGRGYLRLELYEKALSNLQRSLSRHPRAGSEHYLILDIYRRLGRTEEMKREAALIRELKLKERETVEILTSPP